MHIAFVFTQATVTNHHIFMLLEITLKLNSGLIQSDYNVQMVFVGQNSIVLKH